MPDWTLICRCPAACTYWAMHVHSAGIQEEEGKYQKVPMKMAAPRPAASLCEKNHQTTKSIQHLKARVNVATSIFHKEASLPQPQAVEHTFRQCMKKLDVWPMTK